VKTVTPNITGQLATPRHLNMNTFFIRANNFFTSKSVKSQYMNMNHYQLKCGRPIREAYLGGYNSSPKTTNGANNNSQCQLRWVLLQ